MTSRTFFASNCDVIGEKRNDSIVVVKNKVKEKLASSRNFITMLLLQQRNIFTTVLYLVLVLIGNLIALLITHFFC